MVHSIYTLNLYKVKKKLNIYLFFVAGDNRPKFKVASVFDQAPGT